MANPQKENGYTAIANEILEKVIGSGLNGTEIAVLLFVWRKTYGYQKKEDEISLSQFLQAIPITKQTLCTALTNLQLVNILRLVSKGTSRLHSNKWEFNKNYDSWQLVKKFKLVKVSPKTSQGLHSDLVKKPRHTKETKENTKQRGVLKPNFKYGVDKEGRTVYEVNGNLRVKGTDGLFYDYGGERKDIKKI